MIENSAVIENTAANRATRAPKGGGRKAKGKGGAARATKANVDPTRAKGTARTRSGTKQEQLVAMLRRSEGATIDEIADALAWQRHTVRGSIAGALKTKLGLTVTSDKVEGRGRVYRIPL